jgi:hypothetical protein
LNAIALHADILLADPRKTEGTNGERAQPAGYFLFLELPFSPEDFESEDLLSELLESDPDSEDLESDFASDFPSADFSDDFEEPSPELSLAGAPDFFPA